MSTINKYINKTKIVEAVQFTKDNRDELMRLFQGRDAQSYRDRVRCFIIDNTVIMHIVALEDWIINDGHNIFLHNDKDFKEKYEPLKTAKRFPMMNSRIDIDWETAEKIYHMYSTLYGTSASLERIAERGGFGWEEVAIIEAKYLKRGHGHDTKI